MRRIVVVGGGISGIAAALEASQCADTQVRLLESSGRLGGVLETIYDGDYLIERSADNFATLIPDARNLSEQHGLLPELIQPNQAGRQAFVFLNGRIQPIPAGFSLMQPTRVMSILTTGTLTLRGKLRLLQEYFIAAPDNASGQRDESLESFATRRLGKEAFDKLVEPIVSGIFTADPRTLSMEATLPQFLQMERKHGGLMRGYLASKREDASAAARRASGARYDQFMAPRRGMSSWIEGLAQQLPSNCVQLNTTVQKIVRPTQPDGQSTWQIELEQGEPITADAIVLATPTAITSKLIADVAPSAAQLTENVPYASSAVVAMIVNRQEIAGRLDGFGLVVPSCEKRSALAISYTSNKYPGRTPDDQILLRIFLGGAMHPEVMDLSDARLTALAESETRDILGWSGQGIRWQGVIRWNQAMPQYLVGHVERMEQLQREIDPLQSLQLCGAGYHGVGIPQCVRSAKQAVSRLIKNLGLNRN